MAKVHSGDILILRLLEVVIQGYEMATWIGQDHGYRLAVDNRWVRD